MVQKTTVNGASFSANVKLSSVGGRYTSPVNIAASQMQHQTVYDETLAPYSIHLQPYFRADVKFGYRKNNPKSTLECGIDLEKVTMHQNIFMQSYNVQAQKVVAQYQQGFLPVP